MIIFKILEGRRAQAVFRYLASLTTHDGVFGIVLPQLACGIAFKSAGVVGIGTKAVVMAAQSGDCRTVVRSGCGDGVLHGKVVHLHLEGRGAQLDLARYGHCVQKGVGEGPAVFHLGEVGGIVPLAPGTYEAGLQYEQHIFKTGEDGLYLLHVLERDGEGRLLVLP